MKLHSSVGADILSAIDFPYPVVPIVRHHHENWDGTGYPDGLSGTSIPLGARILSVVDCFDALTSDRPYRPRLADKDALNILRQRRGSMYDPLIVDTFLEVHKDIAPKPVLSLSDVRIPVIGTIGSSSGPSTVPADPLDDISSSTEEMLTLFELAQGLYGQMSLQDAGDVVVKHLRRLLPSSLVVFFLYDDEADELVAAHTAGDGAALVNGFRIGIGQRLSGWVAAHKETIRNSDPVLDFGDAAKAINPRLRSVLKRAIADASRSRRGSFSLFTSCGRILRGPSANRRSNIKSGIDNPEARSSIRARPQHESSRPPDGSANHRATV